MRTEPVTFYSDGLELSGAFFLPDEEIDGPRPLVMPCSGFTGLMRIHPERFARHLTGRGHLCFGFDYRGFADSEGPAGRVILEEQVRDIRAAAAFAAADERVDMTRIILLGWGMAGGLVIDASRELPGVCGLIAANGFYDGRRFQAHHRGEEGLARFARQLEDEQRQRARTGDAKYVDPFDLYPLDPQSRRYVDDVLRKTEDYEAERYSCELGESLMRWNVDAYAPRMNLPLLVAHGDANRLHPPSEAQALFDAWGGDRSLYWLEGAGHTEFMHDDDAKFLALADRLASWIENLTEAA